MEYFIYILFSKKLNRFYIGHTQDIETRLSYHNEGKSKYTSRGIPWELCYTEPFISRAEAMSREYEIKQKKSRKYIEWLITQK